MHFKQVIALLTISANNNDWYPMMQNLRPRSGYSSLLIRSSTILCPILARPDFYLRNERSTVVLVADDVDTFDLVAAA